MESRWMRGSSFGNARGHRSVAPHDVLLNDSHSIASISGSVALEPTPSSCEAAATVMPEQLLEHHEAQNCLDAWENLCKLVRQETQWAVESAVKRFELLFTEILSSRVAPNIPPSMPLSMPPGDPSLPSSLEESPADAGAGEPCVTGGSLLQQDCVDSLPHNSHQGSATSARVSVDLSTLERAFDIAFERVVTGGALHKAIRGALHPIAVTHAATFDLTSVDRKADGAEQKALHRDFPGSLANLSDETLPGKPCSCTAATLTAAQPALSGQLHKVETAGCLPIQQEQSELLQIRLAMADMIASMPRHMPKQREVVGSVASTAGCRDQRSRIKEQLACASRTDVAVAATTFHAVKGLGESEDETDLGTVARANREQLVNSMTEMSLEGSPGIFSFRNKWDLLRRNLTNVSTCVVILNTIFIGAQMDGSVKAAFAGESCPEWMEYCDITFTVVFIVELVLRLLLEGREFFTGADRNWNGIDSFLVITSMLERIMHTLDLSFMRSLKVFRVVRSMRVVRVVRMFRTLRLMIASIISSLISMMWALLVLFLVVYLCAILVLSGVLGHAQTPGAEATDLNLYYGSLSSSMVSLFLAISGGMDWRDLVLPLEQISSWWLLFFILYVAFVVLGMMNILTGIFVESARNIADVDQDLVIREQMHQSKSAMSAIRRSFALADKDKDGIITRSELSEHLSNAHVVGYLHSLDLGAPEVWSLFQLLDVDQDHSVQIEELLHAMIRLKGGAKGVDVATLIYESKRMNVKMHSWIVCLIQKIENLENTFGIES